jgi:hypothetical protein
MATDIRVTRLLCLVYTKTFNVSKIKYDKYTLNVLHFD